MPDDGSQQPESRPAIEQQWSPGWYADPWAGASGAIRWWDGAQWTGEVRVPRQGPRPAGWWWRALAMFLDGLLVSIVTTLVTLPAQLGYQRALQEEQARLQLGLEQGRADDAFRDYWSNIIDLLADRWVWLFAVPILLTAAYHLLMLRNRGGTFGKLMLGMRVVPAAGGGGDDDRLSWSSVVRRVLVQMGPAWLCYPAALLTGSLWVLAVVALVVPIYTLIDHLWAAGTRRRALHDLAAGTRVVKGDV